ncbi:acetyl-CoA carboxylase biotin carboxyl carrier protein subunit [Salegentibacter sediminis]|uniref:acetyl-CoA carboxylase biotin carboxyl carrier protein subunit n=1 Tax=Salegentibacter sediminis TaxID=1930251 RepID=UPI0009BFEC87|nr:acetyl-CoA carboxylase biotin carboxyl carrier protein subunit [Salegentibacter sediminis]
MEKKFSVKVNDSFEFEFTQDEINALDTQQVSVNNYHMLSENRSFKGTIAKADFLNREYQVKINSNNYQVKISNELDQLIDKMGLSLSSALMVNDIKAPMPGLILDVMVKEGDEVKEGDYLLVLEAMKMENTLSAPRDGVVKAISVEKGQGVDKNQLLIEMD